MFKVGDKVRFSEERRKTLEAYESYIRLGDVYEVTHMNNSDNTPYTKLYRKDGIETHQNHYDHHLVLVKNRYTVIIGGAKCLNQCDEPQGR